MTYPMDYWQLKMRRANQHLEALDAECRRIEETCVNGIVTQQQRDGDALYFRRILGQAAQPYSERLGMLVGDFLQNLRSSLDHLISVLTWDYSGHLSDGTEFPIFHDRHKYHRRHNGGGPYKIRDIAPAAKAIIESLQPYHGRNDAERRSHPLRVLHELANFDKHAVTPWCWMDATHVEPSILEIEDMAVDSIEVLPNEGPVNMGTKFSLITARMTGPNPRMEMQDNIDFKVRFDQRTFAPGQPVDETCRRLRHVVLEEIFPLFERFHKSPIHIVVTSDWEDVDPNDPDAPWAWEEI